MGQKRTRHLGPLLGISVGSIVTASMLHELTDFSILLGLLIRMTMQIFVGYNWLRRLKKWGHIEGLPGSIPGAMAAVMTVSSEQGPASGRIAFVHIVRVLALLAVEARHSLRNALPAGQRYSSAALFQWKSLIEKLSPLRSDLSHTGTCGSISFSSTIQANIGAVP